MTLFLPEQRDGLRELLELCRSTDIDVVIIGAMAYRFWIDDPHRHTEDVDVVLALDLDELSKLGEPLAERGWRQDARLEHRWRNPQGARFDVLPVGRKAQLEKEILWPRSGIRMNVVGFDHVFRDAVEFEVVAGLKARIVPLVVLAFTKMISYMDDPYARRKDLEDVLAILRRYEERGERRFGDEVIESGVEYDAAGAYLLGRDLRALCVGRDEITVVESFLERVGDPDFMAPHGLRRFVVLDDDESERPFARELGALIMGFGTSR